MDAKELLARAYTIRPLKWEHSKKKDSDEWSASTIFCTVYVHRWKDEDNRWTSWKFSYCIDEYYNEEQIDVDSAEDGKTKAEDWYLGLLMPALSAAEECNKP